MEQCRSKKRSNEGRGYHGRPEADAKGDPCVLRLGETHLPQVALQVFVGMHRGAAVEVGKKAFKWQYLPEVSL